MNAPMANAIAVAEVTAEGVLGLMRPARSGSTVTVIALSARDDISAARVATSDRRRDASSRVTPGARRPISRIHVLSRSLIHSLDSRIVVRDKTGIQKQMSPIA